MAKQYRWTDQEEASILPTLEMLMAYMPGATGVFHVFQFPHQECYEFKFEFEDSNDAGKVNVYFIKA